MYWASEFPSTGPTLVEISWETELYQVTATVADNIAKEDLEQLRKHLNWMFREEEQFEEFWVLCARSSTLTAIADNGSGALLRSGSLFEDVIKTLCTVNCTWQNTLNMVHNLCEYFGNAVPNVDHSNFTFPTPATLANASDESLKKARLGFRGAWIRGFAKGVVSGDIDLPSWTSRTDSTDLRKDLLQLKGFGPYVVDHILMMLGHYEFLPIDSIATKYLAQHDNESLSSIRSNAELRFADWSKYKFLAFHFESKLNRLEG